MSAVGDLCVLRLAQVSVTWLFPEEMVLELGSEGLASESCCSRVEEETCWEALNLRSQKARLVGT